MSMITEQVEYLIKLSNKQPFDSSIPTLQRACKEAADTIEQLAAKVRKENGFIFPDNATNGDMIKALFPNCVIDTDSCGDIATSIDGKIYWSKKWWNSPYKRGDTE